MSGWRRLLAALVVSTAAGWLIFRLWARFGVPVQGGPLDAPVPGLWRWFFALCLPGLFVGFTGVHGLLIRAAHRGEVPHGVVERALARDRRSYLGLAVFLLALATWRQLGDWRLALGALFVGLLFAKTLALVVALYRGYVLPPGIAERPDDPRSLSRLLVLVPLLVYALLAPYVVTAVSTAGDEHVYLLNTVSLLRDRDVDITDNVARREYEPFYWGRPAPSEWREGTVAFPALLLPGYAAGSLLLPRYPLAGRLGATLTIALFAALLAREVYRLCRDVGASRPAAFWAWLVVAFTPPMVVGANHLYPEVPVAWATVAAVRAVLRIPGARWRGLAIAAALGVGLILVKRRYVPIAVGLGAWGLARLLPRALVVPAVVLGAGLAVGVGWLVGNPFPWLLARLGVERLPPLEGALLWNERMTVALLGILADQEFGLLYYGPHFTLVLPGAVLLWRRSWPTVLGLGGLTAAYLVIVVKYRWLQWDAGWTPPPRFVLAVAPLLAPLIAEAFEGCRGRGLAALNTLWLVWSLVLGFALCLVPFWRYNGLTGRSTLLRVAGHWLGLDLGRFLPSFRWPLGESWPGLVVGALLVLAVWRVCMRRRQGDWAEGWGVGAVVLGPGRASWRSATVLAAWLGLAALVPTWGIEAEAMRHDRGLQYGPNAYQPVLWVMRQNGELSERMVTWPGVTEIAVVAGGFTTTGVAPRLTLLLDGEPLGSWALDAGESRWAEATYGVQVPTQLGRSELRLRLTELGDRIVAGLPPRQQHAYVDRVRIRWRPASPR
jgi:hypothetical protein